MRRAAVVLLSALLAWLAAPATAQAHERLTASEPAADAVLPAVPPRVATVTAAVPAYAKSSAGLSGQVAAYLGVPLVMRDGELFGTLCAIAYRAQPLSAARGLATVEFVARMLSTLLAAGPEWALTAPSAAITVH